MARKVNIISFANEDGFSIVPIEGFHNWERLTHVDWVFKNTFGERVKCYVLLDRDYYTENEIEEIIEKVEKKGVKIHVWDRKEIENYLIAKEPLYRMFKNRFSKRFVNVEMPISESSFNKRIDLIFEELKDVVQSQIIARRITNRPDRSIDTSTIISQVLKEFQENWTDSVYRMKVIPGKEFFAKLNTWLNDEYHVTIPIGYAINSLRADEIDSEISEVIKEFMQLVNSK